MAGDASTRSFHRLEMPDGTSAVLMDYGRPFEGETDDVLLARIYRDAGLPVARVLEVVADPGCLVLEDLGDATLEQEAVSKTGDGRDRREALYRRAAGLAAAIAVRGTRELAASDRAEGPTLDGDRFRFEMDFFLEHFVGGLRGREVAPEVREGLYGLADAAADTPRRVLCHRDFHSRNLLVLDDGSLALVDIQDSRWGPDTYDLASLVRDAYVDLDETLVRRIIEWYVEALPWEIDRPAFLQRLETVSLQRMMKALGTFGYQATVRGRERFLDGVPRTEARIRSLLERNERFTVLRALF
jgi:aminoglycoside/choline kinase family phosphotransferase